jgi:sodium-dependent dicarboxylate transporter 2/3/5
VESGFVTQAGIFQNAAFAVLAASCSFILPVGTAPNAIAFGSGHVSGAHMLRHGAQLDVLAALVVTGVSLWLLY